MLEYSGYSLQLTCLVVPWHAAQSRCSSLGRAGRRPVTEAPLGLPYLATRLKAPRAAVQRRCQENRSRWCLLRVETVGLQQPQRGKPEGQPAAPFSAPTAAVACAVRAHTHGAVLVPLYQEAGSHLAPAGPVVADGPG